MSLAEKIKKSKDVWERKGADFYPTPPEVTHALCDFLAALGYEALRVREPCCGDGAMSRVLEARGHHVTSSDIRDDAGYGEKGQDYCRIPEVSSTQYDFEAVITNPPFVSAEKIIRRALRDAPLVAMLLSNNYWHAQSRLRLFQGRPPAYVLPLTWRPQFLEAERGSNALMNVLWTVWDDDYSGPTQYCPIERPNRHEP